MLVILFRCCLLVLALGSTACKHALTPEDLAKRYPHGEFIPSDVQQELHATMKPKEYMTFMQNYQAIIRPQMSADATARGAPYAKARQQKMEQEVDALLTTARTIDPIEKRLVGRWKMKCAGGYISEGPITLSMTLKSNGLGTGDLIDEYPASHKNSGIRDRSVKGRLAWQYSGERLRLVIEHTVDQDAVVHLVGRQIIVKGMGPSEVFVKQ
jgi:hypothetical protein